MKWKVGHFICADLLIYLLIYFILDDIDLYLTWPYP